jgi:isovaleryl-CoA dehydrogenase
LPIIKTKDNLTLSHILQIMIEARQEIKHHFKNWCNKNLPLLEEIESQHTISPNHWLKMGEDGLLGCMIHERYGGSGLSLANFTDMLSEISYHSPSLALSILAHSQLCADLIQTWGSEDQKQNYLPKLALGQLIGSTGISEDNAGSDALSMQTHLTDDYLLCGHKMWITNGPIANISIIYAKHCDEMSALIVDLTPQMKGPAFEKFGMKSSPTGRLTFNRHAVDPSSILPMAGHRILKTALDKERIALSAIPIGIMRRALNEMISHCSIRKQFGKPLAQKQLIGEKIATVHTHLSSSEALMEVTLNQPSISKLDAATLYLHASQCGMQAAELAMDSFGAMGYMVENKSTQLFQDVKLFQTGGGSIEIRKLLISHILTAHYCY